MAAVAPLRVFNARNQLRVRAAIPLFACATPQLRYKHHAGPKQVFVLNCGSSSIKYQLMSLSTKDEIPKVIAKGLVERIGEPSSPIKHEKKDSSSNCADSTKIDMPLPDHTAGLKEVARLVFPGSTDNVDLFAVGHRVVHGGEQFAKSTLINENVVTAIRDNIPLAPLHNPGNLKGIEVGLKLFPKVPQVAVFDTSFHQTMPDYAFTYPIAHEHYHKDKVRKYGFHGTSHMYVADKAAKMLGKPLNTLNLITCHIGNGASCAALHQGKVVDTSMGLTPLEGLMMGTRCGDIDPSIHHYLIERGYKENDIANMLTKKSGLAGICGKGDFRDVCEGYEKGDALSTLAFKMYTYRLLKYVGSYMAVLGGKVDAIIFTAGVGENSDLLRSEVCHKLEPLGVSIDSAKNAARGTTDITAANSRTKVFVIPTDEEAQIAYDCLDCVGQ